MHHSSIIFTIGGKFLAAPALLFILCINVASGQVRSVRTIQNLAFGAFSQGSAGGTLSVSHDGTRSSTGTVVPLNLGYAYFQAIFEVDAPAGTVISILNGPDATLTGSNGGNMSLRLGNSNPASPFITTAENPFLTQVSIAGTLTLGNAQESPPGTYTGTFYITFNNE